jgi:small-conductance mechanosensitive channel
VTILGAALLGLLWSRDAEDLLFTSTAFTLAATLIGGWAAWRAVDHSLGRLTPTPPTVGEDLQGGQPSSRLETVAPLLRILLLLGLGLAVIMISLTTLGVDTGPLLAGAGVIGLAIGFGAQTLIRDIITGVFFLMEDAFRIGEYVDVGNNKRGEVEAISPRSIRLRHHRGAVHRVPFSEIRTLTNNSRDWAIDKILLQVEYGADVEKLRKLVKSIGEELSQDPEIGPSLLGPLKSQGITAFGESGLQIRLKFTARPQELFLVRREAMKRLYAGFQQAGVKFAPARRTIAIETEAPRGSGMVD